VSGKRRAGSLATADPKGNVFPSRLIPQPVAKTQPKRFAVARRPLKPPLDPLAGLEHIGSLVVLGVDSTGKRTLTRCSCGEVREISTEAIQTGERRSCGACGGSRRS
jgi:hypothetical protein